MGKLKLNFNLTEREKAIILLTAACIPVSFILGAIGIFPALLSAVIIILCLISLFASPLIKEAE